MSVEWAEGDETKGKEVRRSDQLLTSHAYTHLGHAQVHIGELLAVNPNVCLKPSSPRISQTPSHNRQQQQPTNRRKTVNSPAAQQVLMPLRVGIAYHTGDAPPTHLDNRVYQYQWTAHKPYALSLSKLR